MSNNNVNANFCERNSNFSGTEEHRDKDSHSVTRSLNCNGHHKVQHPFTQNRWATEVTSYVICFPSYLKRLWGSPSLLSNGNRGLFPREKSSLSIKLTIYFHLMLILLCRAVTPLPHTPS